MARLVREVEGYEGADAALAVLLQRARRVEPGRHHPLLHQAQRLRVLPAVAARAVRTPPG